MMLYKLNNIKAWFFCIILAWLGTTGCEEEDDVMEQSCEQVGLQTLVTHPSCGLKNGSIVVELAADAGDYQYSLDSVNFSSDSVFSGLEEGNYTVYVKDENNCSFSTQAILTSEVKSTSVTATVESSNCGMADGAIRASSSGFADGVTYSIDGTAFTPDSLFTGLGAGTYTIIVQDASGCTDSAAFTVQDVSDLDAQVSQSSKDVCGNNTGSFTVSVSGGTMPYLFSLNSGMENSSGEFTGLESGDYTILIEDSNGCKLTLNHSVEYDSGDISGTLQTTSAGCGDQNGSVEVSALNGTPPYTFSLNGGSFQTDSIFTGLAAGNFEVHIQDANGCLAELNDAIMEEEVSFATVIKPIIQNNCATSSNCHNAPSGSRPDFSDDAVIIERASRIKIRAVDQMSMPPGGPLSEADRESIACWVEQGAQNN